MRYKIQLSLASALASYVPFTTSQSVNPGSCPGDGGQYRMTSHGTFLIACNKRMGQDWMNPKEDIRQDFASCIDACAAKSGCFAVDYNQDTKSCGYIGVANLSPTILATTGLGVHNARMADQPPVRVSLPVGTNPQVPIIGTLKNPPAGPSPVVAYSSTATCLGDDGKIFITSEGSAYKLQCSHSNPGGFSAIAGSTTQLSFAACIEKCSLISSCKTVQYNARPASGATPPQGDCILFKEGGDGITNSQYDFAVQIDPPEANQEEYDNEICTTECPYADGMTYSSSFGEAFKMDCGKRHGTKVLSVETIHNFQDCMNLCAQRVACHSVDYQARTKKCYLGSHHGNPLIVASSFDSAHSIGCAGTCDGGGYCNGNVSNGKPVPKEPKPLSDTSCGNEGYSFAIYPNQKDGRNVVYREPNNGDFDPVLVKTIQPYYEGFTTSLVVPNAKSIYGQTPRDDQFVVVNHRGYLYAHQDGEYTFSSPYVDDSSIFWIGEIAYSGWTRPNANIDQAYSASGTLPKQFKMTLERGKYYPIRNIWANTGGPGSFSFKITAPDGTVVVDDKTTSCPFLVRFGCKAEYNAPEFPAWGAES